LNRGWRFCRFNGVVNRVVSCWSLVCPAPPFCLVLGPYWTTFGLRLPVMAAPGDHAAEPFRSSGGVVCLRGGSPASAARIVGTLDRDSPGSEDYLGVSGLLESFRRPMRSGIRATSRRRTPVTRTVFGQPFTRRTPRRRAHRSSLNPWFAGSWPGYRGALAAP
jgi:hypothetical protein